MEYCVLSMGVWLLLRARICVRHWGLKQSATVLILLETGDCSQAWREQIEIIFIKGQVIPDAS